MVARDGPIRGANQDSAAARRARIGAGRSESIEPSTRGFSVQRRAGFGAAKPKTRDEFSGGPTEPPCPTEPMPNPGGCRPTELRRGGMWVNGLRPSRPNRGRAATARATCGAWRYALHLARDTVVSAQGRREVLQDRQQGRHPSSACTPAGATARGAQRGQTTVGHERARLGTAPPQGEIVQPLERQCQRKLATDLHIQRRRRGIGRLPGLPLRFP
jgi:hypothetical protein